MFKKILVPTEGSELSAKPIEAAIKLAQLHGSTIVALAVAEPRLMHSLNPDVVADGTEHEARNREKARADLEFLINAARQAAVSCEPVMVQSRTPYQEIIDVAERYGCDVIFMATRGNFGVLEKMFGASQTHNVIAKTPIPVLVFS
ncbi:MAG TPA: universal stress protein [Noviherbaspirillum sp.]|uniref:universal stress protein n=1 Tax=Noviherbaspirillum sp. TaxID=1926288 RepID=UPI002DDD3B17|nr:universal stress protein [Noviherbaspirillum sp.]HEV2609469.1 universal stress protein [Noviherbaspirillum sp.]